jgi:hypothetical protein
MAVASSRQETLLQTSFRHSADHSVCNLMPAALPCSTGGSRWHRATFCGDHRQRTGEGHQAFLVPTFLASFVPHALIGNDRETWFSKISAAA